MLEIRRLTKSDRPAWERMFRAYLDFYETSIEPAAYDKAWSALLADRKIHARAAWLDGSMSGLAHFLVHGHSHANDLCYLQDLFTVPEARGRGVARGLIGHVTEWARARQCSGVYWQTHVSNTRARTLYDQVAEDKGFMVYEIAL
jgi:GNAT superfamily N-acetyltransferase